MNCPYCGNPMERGRIPGTDRFLCVPWIPSKMKKGAVLPTRAGLLQGGGLVLRDTPFPAVPYKEVFICRACRKGVFSFQNSAGDVEDQLP